MILPRIFVTCVASLLLATSSVKADHPFQFRDGDRVVLLGGTLVEREQKYGSWELAMTLANRDKHVTFRNLGWSGDTVWGESRNSFDPSPKGYERMVTLTKELKPTVIVTCFGQNESFDGPKGLKAYTSQYEKLLNEIAKTKARIVLMSPTPFENVPPMKDTDAKNKNLQLYVTAIQGLAKARKLEFVDLYTLASQQSEHFTENGIHMNSVGYDITARAFTTTIPAIPLGSQTEAIRSKIIEKNQLFFHRWRPQNETYLFGFRKHEQGQNGKEIPEFDPLIVKVESEITELRNPAKKDGAK